MRHVYEVLREKEVAIEQLRREVEALRVVCQMLREHDSALEESRVELSRVEPENQSDRFCRVDDKEESLARIRARLDSEVERSAPSPTSVLLQFKEAALGASRTLLNRLVEFRSGESEPERKTIRYLFARFGRTDAA